jgi:hypothetical protein
MCTNVQNDPANCGTCGNACGAGLACASGHCTTACLPGLIQCAATYGVDAGADSAIGMLDAAPVDAGPPICTNPQLDDRNCGACGVVCAASQTCLAGACAYPVSCADLAYRKGPLPDGKYTVDPDGASGPIPPFPVYCAGMGGPNPKDYLELPDTFEGGATGSNVITVPPGNNPPALGCLAGCQPITRYWTKVHINVSTLVVDATDLTFSFLLNPGAAACWQAQGGTCAGYLNDSYSAAVACSCGGALGGADVDLRGTQFSIDPSVSPALGGAGPSGSAAFGAARQTLDETGGGCCGGMGPSGPLKLTACTGDLSSTGGGDFHVSLTLQTTQTSSQFAVVNQRAACNAGNFWSLRVENNVVVFETDAIVGGNPVDSIVNGCTHVNDGKVHHVLVQRVAGTMSIYVDGALDASGASTSPLSGLPAFESGNDPCVGVDGTVAFDTTKGSITAACVGPGALNESSAPKSACN